MTSVGHRLFIYIRITLALSLWIKGIDDIAGSDKDYTDNVAGFSFDALLMSISSMALRVRLKPRRQADSLLR